MTSLVMDFSWLSLLGIYETVQYVLSSLIDTWHLLSISGFFIYVMDFFSSVIKHAISKSKMRAGRKIEHHNMKAILYKIL